MQIRAAQRGDASAIHRLRRKSILAHCRSHYPLALLQRWVSGEVTPAFEQFVVQRAFVGVRDGKVVASGALDTATGQVDAIFVDPAYHGLGLGAAMMAFLEVQAQGAGLAALRLDATLNAAGFYRHLGYEGLAESVYHSPRGFSLPCVPMHKHLALR